MYLLSVVLFWWIYSFCYILQCPLCCVSSNYHHRHSDFSLKLKILPSFSLSFSWFAFYWRKLHIFFFFLSFPTMGCHFSSIYANGHITQRSINSYVKWVASKTTQNHFYSVWAPLVTGNNEAQQQTWEMTRCTSQPQIYLCLNWASFKESV